MVFNTTDHCVGRTGVRGSSVELIVQDSPGVPKPSNARDSNKATPSCPPRRRDRNAGSCTNGVTSRSVPERWIRVPSLHTALR
jgi:hypothetical protein